jgi:hypothetical protein
MVHLSDLIGAWETPAANRPERFADDGRRSGASAVSGQASDDLIGADREYPDVSRLTSESPPQGAIRPAAAPTARDGNVARRKITSAAAGGMAQIYAAFVSISSH